ncbi:MAG: hypothetical protein AAF191_07510 [Verrucomicrobiota bacterium]
MTSVRYEFQIPDETKPLDGEGAPWGPFYELVEFVPPPLKREEVVGRTVDEISTRVGTYGMGGPGFLGLRLGSEWLVCSIWGAAAWIEVDGRIISDDFWEKGNLPRPWISDEEDELSEKLIGQKMKGIQIDSHSLSMEIGVMNLSISEEPDRRPIYGGSREPRVWEEDDDLRKAIFLAPTTELWV